MTAEMQLDKSGVSQELFKLGTPKGQAIEYAAGQVVCEPNDPAKWFYLIESGEIRLYHANGNATTRLLDILGPEDWIGSEALGKLATYGKKAVAISRAVLWAIPAQDMHIIISEHAELAAHLVERMAQKLEEAWSDGSRMIFDDCRHRLVQTLLRFSHSPAAQATPDGVVLRITHKQLAQAVGAARETISVCLTELRRENMVLTGRNQLRFDPRQLEQLDA
jgi:CRP/FNR family cyclic AMP-dependent transcriptional regulator